jgi:hypothetical protein
MRVRFSWSRIVDGDTESAFGALVVLKGADGRPYLQLQVQDDYYDGVIKADDVAELQATLAVFLRETGGS